MSGITAMGTTYNLPNYTGLLYGLSPRETPFFSAIGGLNGGMQTDSTEFEWGYYDLRAPGQNVQLEGATAPTAQGRVRSNGSNVTQIHQEKVSVSYSRQGATGMKSGVNNTLQSSVTNELDWQTEQMLVQMVRDVEYSFMLGSYNKPTDNTTKRQTRGLLTAIATNKVDNSTSTVTGLSASTDTITETATALSNGDKIVFTDTGASTAISTGRTYYVVSKSTNAFKVSLTSGGSANTIGTATVAYRKPYTTALTPDTLSASLQSIYDNGGMRGGELTLLVNSTQKIKISSAYASAYGKFTETSRTVGGVGVDSIVTDFGTLNIMLSRFVPQDAIAAVALSECRPVYLEVPGKGHFFAEPLAKTGASDEVQLYGEVGLAYGNERDHGLITGLAI
jgi:hypothetical protein